MNRGLRGFHGWKNLFGVDIYHPHWHGRNAFRFANNNFLSAHVSFALVLAFNPSE